jgi:hypothetical protein
VPYIFTLGDNTASASWTFQYGKGNGGYTFSKSETLSVLGDTITVTIPQGEISESYGLRAQLTVSDGVFSQTVDLSRRVQCLKGEQITSPGMRWIPLHTTAQLQSASTAAVLSNLGKAEAGWSYDKSSFRLFRWNADEQGRYAWQEYSDDNAGQFSFLPSRLLWIKTREQALIDFGKGFTTSLKEPYKVTLDAKSWTDFSLPFKFEVSLSDVIATTGVEIFDSLEVSHWSSDDDVYSAQSFFMPAFDEVGQKSFIYEPLNDAYCIYNRFDHPVTLLIPPRPAVLAAGNLTKAKRATAERWDIWLGWHDKNRGVDQRIRVGYDGRGDAAPSYSPLPPSFSNLYGGVYDSSSETLYGHSMLHDKKNGGFVWEIRFRNCEAGPRTVEYSLGNLQSLPTDLQARVFEGSLEGSPLQGESQSVTLRANSDARRFLVVGSAEFLDGFRQSLVARPATALLPLYPNPVQKQALIRYQLPGSDVRQVRFALYSLSGREAWSRTIGSGLATGVNVLRWDGRDNAGRPLAAGMYLLRMTVTTAQGASQLIGSQRITFMP